MSLEDAGGYFEPPRYPSLAQQTEVAGRKWSRGTRCSWRSERVAAACATGSGVAAVALAMLR
jgi:hypothetical protein